MATKIPVYTEDLGIHRITVYEEMGDGTFRRTATELLREFKNSITSVGTNEGEIVSNRFDRTQRDWQTPTVLHQYGRAKSFYAFSRSQIKKNKIYVGSISSLHGKVVKFSLHELKFGLSSSQGLRTLAIKKYQEAIELW